MLTWNDPVLSFDVIKFRTHKLRVNEFFSHGQCGQCGQNGSAVQRYWVRFPGNAWISIYIYIYIYIYISIYWIPHVVKEVQDIELTTQPCKRSKICLVIPKRKVLTYYRLSCKFNLKNLLSSDFPLNKIDDRKKIKMPAPIGTLLPYTKMCSNLSNTHYY
jgi:hypothetical protein